MHEDMTGDSTVAVGRVGHYCKDVPRFWKQNHAGTAQNLALIHRDEEADWRPTYGPHKSKKSPQAATMQVLGQGVHGLV